MSCNGDCNQGRECNCECKMTKDEALRMAIESMELHGNQYPHMVKGYILDAIQACKEALAETQEPMIIKQENGIVLKLGYDELPNGAAFYTTPPSRQWVGLSNDDLYKILNDNIGSSSYAIAHAISEALREKNT